MKTLERCPICKRKMAADDNVISLWDDEGPMHAHARCLAKNVRFLVWENEREEGHLTKKPGRRSGLVKASKRLGICLRALGSVRSYLDEQVKRGHGDHA